MKSAQYGQFDNGTCFRDLGDEPMSRIVSGYTLANALVWTGPVETRTEGSERPSKMVVAHDQDVVEAFAADSAEEPFADRVAVRRGRRDSDDRRSAADGDRIKDRSELAVVILDEKPRTVVERHRFAKLQGGPLVGQVERDVTVNGLAAVEPNDEKREDRSESEVVQLQEVACPDLILMVFKEGSPGLPATPIRPDAPNVPLDRSFGDPEPKLEELAPNSLAAPSTIETRASARFNGRMTKGARTPPARRRRRATSRTIALMGLLDRP